MAFRYNVNLIKEQVARTESERAFLQLITFSLLIFAVVLLVTFGVYLSRDTVAQYNLEARNIAGQLKKFNITPEAVEALRATTHKDQVRLAAITNLLKGSVSWPHLLVSIENCCDKTGVKMRKISGGGTAQAPVITLDAECTVDNPADVIRKFMNEVAQAPDFGLPNLLAINKRSDLGPHIFQIEIPLKTVGGPLANETPKVTTGSAPAGQTDGGKS